MIRNFIGNDIYVFKSDNIVKESLSRKKPINPTISLLNKAGYIPGISTATGAIRSLAALAYVIHSLFTIFIAFISYCSQSHFDLDDFEEVVKDNPLDLGLRQLAMGLIEMIPLIGNITRIVHDRFRINKFNKDMSKIKDEILNCKEENKDLHYNLFPVVNLDYPIFNENRIRVGKNAECDLRSWMQDFIEDNRGRFFRDTGTACLSRTFEFEGRNVILPKDVRTKITEYVTGKTKLKYN